MLSLRDTEKLQDIRVADDLFGFDTSGFGTGNFLFHGFLVSAGQQAVIEKRVDLAVELPDTPVFLDALVQVKITGGIARHLEKRAAMRPTQFITQRVIFRVALVKLPHVPQVGGREPVSELRHEPPGKGVDDSLAISGTAGSLLLVLHYIFPYLLAELNYKRFMFKKLCILLIFSKLNEIKHLIDKYRMHNLYAIFAKLLNICKQIAGNLVNESGNVPRRGVVPKFSDLEVVALNMASEAVGIDSESLLFANLQEYRVEIPNLISRRQYNDRRKITSSLCNAIRERMVAKMDGGEDYFCIDSKPIEVCRIARSKRCSMGKKDFSKAPGVGYCASQSMYYYGYKLHAVCGLSGVIHSFDLTKASVHDIHYLKDVKVDYSNCTVIGDRGYISAQVQLDLFETANIRLEVPYRCNQKEWKPTFPAFAKARKRIETLFSQLCDQFMIIRNYAKDTDGLFARIIGKISALTILQYINYKNEKPIGRVKYALF